MSKNLTSIFDPTHRYQRFDAYSTARTCVMQFKAYDTVSGIEVQWHEIDITNLTSEQVTKLIAYSETLKNLRCESILSVLCYWIERDKKIFYFITESVSSSPIKEHLMFDNPTITERVIAKWCIPVLKALNVLHNLPNPIIHSRISLSSIYIKPSSGNIKIVAPLINTYYLYPTNNSLKLRLSTPPEALFGNTTTASDVWSFGISLLYLVTKNEPFSECKSPNELISKLTNNELPEALNQVKSPLLNDLIKQCLLPIEKRPNVLNLMSHPFFKQHFEVISDETSQDDTIQVLFTGKTTSSHNDQPPLDI
ncbi:CAMK family protein kinase [Tritrichomonas foetus]|uniref:CAMK family protein kinase n=1 Tax=Tritrichomonas foetus TaxID=1144522 RepID=A0A1J4J686_9EUKA|nr:CAMK family protein kinase [Tritrichomonas foetus]|eukprot:OHS94704.1 CAMK family protein kinase [Tritrichomonas foetus]